MYKFKTNKETKKLELYNETMNTHSSILAIKNFDTIFTREYARFEFFSLQAKIDNGTNSKEEEEKYCLLRDTFNFDNTITDDFTTLADLQDELKPLMILTLFAHGKLLKSYEYDYKAEKNQYSIKAQRLSLGLSDFYKESKKVVQAIENGSFSIENGVQELKPLYNKACCIINHKAVDGVCKKWEESTKEKCTWAFTMGLLSKYKLTRFNRIKAESPLKSQESFEKYFAMWLVTEGTMVQGKKNKNKSIETFESFCNRK